MDVRDVAQAHINAGYIPSTSGRHILVSRSATMLELGRALAESFGDRYPFPKRELPTFMVWLAAPTAGLTRKYVAGNMGHPLKFDNTRSRKDLGIECRPVEATVVDHFQQLIDDGIVKKK